MAVNIIALLLISTILIVNADPEIHGFQKFTEADAIDSHPAPQFNSDWFNHWLTAVRNGPDGGLFNYFPQNEHKEEPVNHYSQKGVYPRVHGPNGNSAGSNARVHGRKIDYNNLVNNAHAHRAHVAKDENSAVLGNQQSPINVINNQLEVASYSSKLKWKWYGEQPAAMFVENNGHTAQLTLQYKYNIVPSISNGPLNSTYLLSQIHFHWGSIDKQGSEHTVDNERFPLEMHLVHFNNKYTTVGNAIGKPDGITVVAFMASLPGSLASFWPNKGFRSLTSEFPGLLAKSKKQLKNPFSLETLMTPFYKDYITYSGSLTTEPYSEGVTWIISAFPLYIAKSDLKAFRTLLDEENKPIVDNYREIQPLNGRRIKIVE